VDGLIHREDKPALIKTFNGFLYSETYYLNNMCGRKDSSPSEIFYYNNGQVEKEYYTAGGLIHREDGPAIIYYNYKGHIINEVYSIDGNYLSKSEYYKQIKLKLYW
jgi:hypothetical protein